MLVRSTQSILARPTSCPIPTTPITSPCSSRLVVAFNNTSNLIPAFVIRGNSKFLEKGFDKSEGTINI